MANTASSDKSYGKIPRKLKKKIKKVTGHADWAKKGPNNVNAHNA